MVGKLQVSFGKAVIKESGNMLKNISQILEENECFGQAVSSKSLASKKHAEHAVEQTLMAFRNKRNFVEKKELELLLRLSGLKSLPKAIEAFGLKDGEQEIALIAFGERPENAVKEIKELLELKEAKHNPDLKAVKEQFDIKESELSSFKGRQKPSALESAVLEKIALLELEH